MKNNIIIKIKLIILILVLNTNLIISAQEITNPEDTEVWGPTPLLINTPSQSLPSDAIILFNEKSLDNWKKLDGSKALWSVAKDTFTIKPGTGDIITNQEFADVQLHIEWRTPIEENVMGQNRGNSCLLYTSPSPRDGLLSRMPSSA